MHTKGSPTGYHLVMIGGLSNPNELDSYVGKLCSLASKNWIVKLRIHHWIQRIQ
jgi:hypothetical protein